LIKTPQGGKFAKMKSTRRRLPLMSNVRRMSTSSDNENLIIDARDAARRLQIPLREGSAEEMMWPRSDIQFGAAALSIY
jgi:hypothetical protein